MYLELKILQKIMKQNLSRCFFLQPLPGVALDDDENQEAIFLMGFIYLVMFLYV